MQMNSAISSAVTKFLASAVMAAFKEAYAALAPDRAVVVPFPPAESGSTYRVMVVAIYSAPCKLPGVRT